MTIEAIDHTLQFDAKKVDLEAEKFVEIKLTIAGDLARRIAVAHRKSDLTMPQFTKSLIEIGLKHQPRRKRKEQVNARPANP